MKNGDCGLSVDDVLDTVGGLSADDVLDTVGGVWCPGMPGEVAPAFAPPLAFMASLAKGEIFLFGCRAFPPDTISRGGGINFPLNGLLGVEVVELGRESSFVASCSSLVLLRLGC